MAIWQYTFHLSPTSSIQVIKNAQAAGLNIGQVDVPPLDSAASSALIKSLESSFPREATWNTKVRRWGKESDVIVEVWLHNDVAMSIRVRVHAASFEKTTLDALSRLAIDHKLKAVLPNLDVIEPSVAAIEKEIRSSKAAQFVNDPNRTLESLNET